jgi:hypothetical protein
VPGQLHPFNPEHRETKDQLFAKFERLQAAKA